MLSITLKGMLSFFSLFKMIVAPEKRVGEPLTTYKISLSRLLNIRFLILEKLSFMTLDNLELKFLSQKII